MSPALCQWSEVMNHPGLVCCVQQTTGIPLVIMVKPDTFLIQEIKTLPAKAKVRFVLVSDNGIVRKLSVEPPQSEM